jgi:hypothetical protein
MTKPEYCPECGHLWTHHLSPDGCVYRSVERDGICGCGKKPPTAELTTGGLIAIAVIAALFAWTIHKIVGPTSWWG